MSRLVVRSFGLSIDGYGAGPKQDLQNPLGVRGLELVDWVVHTRTHHARESLRMTGSTEFHFVTGGVQVALQQAKAAAGAGDIRLGGGVATVLQYLRAGLVDELHLAIRPVLLGSGENLWNGLDMSALGYEFFKTVSGGRATHVLLRRRS